MLDVADARYDDAVPIRKRDPKVSRAFGRALKIARVRADLKRAEVALPAGLRADEIGRYERGEREPTLSVFLALSQTLGLGAVDLLRETVEQLREIREKPANP